MIASDRGVTRKEDTRKGHSVEAIEGDLAVGCEELERGENAKPSVMVAVRMEVPESRCSSAKWPCSRQPRLGSSYWDPLAQFSVIEVDVENQTQSAFRYHDDGGNG